MRPLLPALACLALSAQTPEWTAYVENWKHEGHSLPWLLAPKDQLPSRYFRTDETLIRLSSCGDLLFLPQEEEDMKRLVLARQWKQPQWILLDPKGEVLGEGTKLPSGDELQAMLSLAGFPNHWELLATFLREHPDNGHALQQQLGFAIQMGRRRFARLADAGRATNRKFVHDPGQGYILPGHLSNPADAEVAFQEIAETLERISQLPDAWRLSNAYLLGLFLQIFDGGASQDIRRSAGHFAQFLLEDLRRAPSSEISTNLVRESRETSFQWWICQQTCDGKPPALPNLEAAPGHMWPQAGILLQLGEQFTLTQASEGLLAFLEAIPIDAPRTFLSREHWQEYTEVCGIAALLRARAHAELQQWPQALEALELVHTWQGSQWKRGAAFLKSRFAPEPAPGEKPGPPLAPKAFLDALDREAGPEPSAPTVFGPLRLTTTNQLSLGDLKNHSALLPWGPQDLGWGQATQAEEARLKAAGLEGPGWGLWKADGTLLAQGQGKPEPAALVALLEAQGPSRLQRLDTFLRAHPDHVDAHLERYALLRGRLPNAALEPRLAEDAVAAQRPLDFRPEDPCIQVKTLWETRARKLVPELEQALQRWPGDSCLWRAWVSWTPFLPKPPSVPVFSDSLAVFGSRDEWRASLPIEVHQAVIRECTERKQFQVMEAWFDSAWKGLLPSLLDTESQKPKQQMKRDQAIHDGLKTALSALRRTEELKSLEQTWSALTRQP